jgi:adenosine deaminase/adenosine deaminase CECR1
MITDDLTSFNINCENCFDKDEKIITKSLDSLFNSLLKKDAESMLKTSILILWPRCTMI